MWFKVVEDLAVDDLQGTLFIDWYVHYNVLSKQKLIPWHSQPVDILTKSLKASNAISFADHQYATSPANETCHKVVAAKPATMAPCSLTPAMITSAWSGFSIIEPKTLRVSPTSMQVARGTVDVALCKAFYVLLTNLSKKQVLIQSIWSLHKI